MYVYLFPFHAHGSISAFGGQEYKITNTDYYDEWHTNYNVTIPELACEQ